MDRRFREVRHGAEFDTSWHELNLDPKALEPLIIAVKWLIGRTADDCPADTAGLRHYAHGESERLPALTFYFTIDDFETCTIRLVRHS